MGHHNNGLQPLEHPRRWQIDEIGFYVEDIHQNLVGDPFFFYQIITIEKDKDRDLVRLGKAATMYLQVEELAALWHLPHNYFDTQTIIWKKRIPEVTLKVRSNQTGTQLGFGEYHGQRVPVFIHDEDRTTHMNIIGRTGVGKTNLMHHLIHQDIANGRGIVVLDPLGNLIKRILRCSIPQQRINDVVVLDFAQINYPVPLNIFANTQSYSSVARVVDTIERLYANTGVRMDRFLRSIIRALLHQPQATMRDVYRFLMDDTFCYEVLRQIDDDDIFEYLHKEYYEAADSQKRQIKDPIISRVSPFFQNEVLYPSLCHPDCIDFKSLIEANKIVLISLGMDREKVPDRERNMVGSLIISLLQMMGMSTQHNVPSFYVYVDEVQDFVGTSLPQVFSHARQFGMSMIVAHQFFHQLPTDVRHAITSNVGATIMFQSNKEDALALAPYMQDTFHTEDLVGLNRFEAAVKMRYLGETQDAFMLFPPKPLNEPEYGIRIEAASRYRSIQTHTPKSRNEVKTWLRQKYPPVSRHIKPPLGYDDMVTPVTPSAPSADKTGNATEIDHDRFIDPNPMDED